MKKVLVLIVLVLLASARQQFVSLRDFSEMRELVAGRRLTEVMTGSPASDILIGVAWPFAANRDGMAEGLLLGQEEINARGGVRGRRIVLLMRDDNNNETDSRRIAIEFARDPRMVATIGYYDDRSAVRASMIFEESHLLHIVAGANNSYMTTHGFKYLIRSVLANDRVGPKLARMCLDLGFRNFAMIGEEGPFGDDLVYQIGTELDAKDASVVYQSSFVPGRGVDFRDKVNELKQVSPDVIIFAGLETDSALFLKAARTLGLQTPILGSFSDTPHMRKLAGSALEGTMFYDIYDVDSPASENQSFVAKYRQRFGYVPTAYAAQGYDALQVLAKAVDATGSSSGLDLAYAIRFMGTWQGANGAYTFDAAGELADKNLFLKVFRGGKSVLLATSHPE